MSTLNVYRHGSKVFQPINVTDGTNTYTTGVTVCVVPNGASTDTATFAPAAMYGGKAGVWVQGFAPGVYDVIAKTVANQEIPELSCGSFQIT